MGPRCVTERPLDARIQNIDPPAEKLRGGAKKSEPAAATSRGIASAETGPPHRDSRAGGGGVDLLGGGLTSNIANRTYVYRRFGLGQYKARRRRYDRGTVAGDAKEAADRKDE